MALVVYTGGGTKENYVNSHTTGAGGDSNTSSLRRPADGFVGLVRIVNDTTSPLSPFDSRDHSKLLN